MATTQTIVCALNGFTATNTQLLFIANKRCYIQSAKIVSSLVTVSDASNLYTMKIRNSTAANDLTSAAISTNGNDFAVAVVKSIPIDQNNDVKVDDVISIVITETGTATDLTTASLVVVLEVMYPDGYKV